MATPPGWGASVFHVLRPPPHDHFCQVAQICRYQFILLGGEKQRNSQVSRQEHHTKTLPRARTQTGRSRIQPTNHLVTVPPPTPPLSFVWHMINNYSPHCS